MEVRDLASKIRIAVVAVLLALLVSAIFTARAEAEPVVASYYGTELAGNATASGEIFDPYGYTAAHPSLPFGTQLEVCYQGCVTVTVNDRGPFVGGRGLDLSLGAAQAIGLTGPGVATIDVTTPGSGGETSAPAESAPVEEVAPVEESALVAEPVEAAAYDQPVAGSETGYVPEVSVALNGTESAAETAGAYANAYANAYAAATGYGVLAQATTTVTDGNPYTEVLLSNL